MKILIVDNGTSYLKNLEELCAGHSIKTILWTEFRKEKQESVDLIVLSGGHGHPVMGHENEFRGEMEFIKNSPVPILGICLGFEIIARAFGAVPELLTQREKGILEVAQVAPDPIFEGIAAKFLVYESHRWAIGKVPPVLVSLAQSRNGIEIMRHAEKNIYGFQFHPEMFVEKTKGEKLFRNLLTIFENKKNMPR